MNVLLVGNGAREHAISKALKKSRGVGLYSFMTAKNPGIAGISKKTEIGNICDGDAVAKFALKSKVDLAVIGPETPLGAGVVDALEKEGIKCAGPRKTVARLETDKSYTRNLMKRYGIGGLPDFRTIRSEKEAEAFLKDYGREFVVKPVGLTGGKGVMISGEHLKTLEEGIGYAKKLIRSDGSVVIEEKLNGEEFTLQAFVDGKTVLGTPAVQDHKRAYDGDIGPNTGGMGSYSDAVYTLPFMTEKHYDEGIKIMKDTIRAVKKDTGADYRGFLYGQFIITEKGIKLIEFNARLGDPEAMNMLSVLKTDFADVCGAIAEGGLDEIVLRFENKATVCKYLVPSGYPESPRNNVEVFVDEKGIEDLRGQVYYASVREESGRILTSTSRAIAVVGTGATITDAEAIAQRCIGMVKGDLFYRKDIGTPALIEKRIRHVRDMTGGNSMP